MESLKGWYRVVWNVGREVHAVKCEYIGEENKFLVFSLPSKTLIRLNPDSIVKIEEIPQVGP